MKYKTILLTGGAGTLGRAISGSSCFQRIFAPSHQTMDITKPEEIASFFTQNSFDAVIHCAAVARMAECENNPLTALDTNLIGTCNLVKEVIRSEQTARKNIRFVYVSTDGVYPGTRGNYRETDETIPYNRYGWTKLGGECAVNLLSNFCIIRTSFIDPANIKFDRFATDMYSSKVPVGYLAEAIAVMLESDFTGTVNIGAERKSDYERNKEFKPSAIPCHRQDILKNLNFRIAVDASLDSARWCEIKKASQNRAPK